ncbi:MAG: GNAT family N-acetyltransferase [Eubacteriales bacterium]
MDIKITKVKKGMGKDFAEYYENLDFSHEPFYSTCFCRFYHLDTDMDDWKQRTGETNKKETIDAIDAGEMTGFLAYEGEKCIGWLNANHWSSYKRLHPYVSDVVGDKKVGIVICYVIHPEYRNMGVASSLLDAAIQDFKNQGFDAIMALPIKADGFSQKHYRGTVGMYEKTGFVKINEFEYGHVYWKDLIKE